MADPPPQEPALGPSKKPRKKRRALRIGLSILAVPFGLTALGLGYLHTGAGKTRVRHAIEERLGERVNGKVEVGSVDYTLFGEVKAGDIHVKDEAGGEAAALASIAVSPSWSDLIGGRIVLDRVAVTGARVHIVKDADGGSNLQRLIKPRPEDPNKKPFDRRIEVKALSIGDVSVDIVQPDGTRLILSDAALEGTVAVLPSAQNVDVEIGKIALAASVDKGEGELKLGVTGFETGLTIKLDGGKGRATLHPLKGHVAVTLPRADVAPSASAERGFDIALDGFSADIADEGIGLSLDKLLAGAVALASVEVKGRMADGKMDGKQAADVLGLKVSGARVNELIGREVLLCDIDVETHIHGPPDKIEFTSKITTVGVALTFDGALGVADPSCPTYDVALSMTGVDTEKLLSQSLGFSPVGIERLDVTLKGQGRNAANTGAVAKVRITGVKTQGVRIDGVDFEGELDKGILKVKSIDAKGLGQQVKASGEIELANKRVDLNIGVEGDVGDLLGKLKAAGIPVKSSLPRGAVRFAPGDFNLHAKGNLAGVLDVTATAKRIGVLGGTVGLNARASVLRHDPPVEGVKPISVTAMDADLHVAGVKLSSLLALRGKKLEGIDATLSGDVQVGGTPEKPRAKLLLGLLTSRADGGKTARLSLTGDINPANADLRVSLTPSDSSTEILGLRAKLPLSMSGQKKGIDVGRPLDIHAELARTKLAAIWELLPKTQAMSNIQTLPEGDVALTLDVNGTAAKPDGKLHATVTTKALPGMTQKVEINGTIRPAEAAPPAAGAPARPASQSPGVALQLTADAWYDDTQPKLARIAADVDLSRSPAVAPAEVAYRLRADIGPLDLKVPTTSLKKMGMTSEVVDGSVFLSADLRGNKEDLTGQVMASAEGLRPWKTGQVNANLGVALGEADTELNVKVRVADSADGAPNSDLLKLSGKLGVAGKKLFEQLKDKEHFDPQLALSLDIPKRALSSLAVILNRPENLAKAPGNLSGAITVSGTLKTPLAKGALALSDIERMDGKKGGLGVSLDAGIERVSALIGAGLPDAAEAPLQIDIQASRDALVKLADAKPEGAVLPVEAKIRAKAVDLRALVPAVLLADSKVGVSGTVDWDMQIKAGLARTKKGLEIAEGGVMGSLDLRGGAIALPGTKRSYHDVALLVKADEKGLHLDALRAKESDLDVQGRSLTVKADVGLDKLAPAQVSLSLAADKWLLFGPRMLGFADAPRGTLSIEAQAKGDMSQPIKKATIDVKKLELIMPERFERAHQPEDFQAGDLVFLDEGKVPLGKLAVPASVSEKAQPKKALAEPQKDSGFDIDIRVAEGAHLLRAPIEVYPHGDIHIKLRPNSYAAKGELKMGSGGGLQLGGQLHPLVKGTMTFDEKNPKGYLDIHFERPMRASALRNISEASAGQGVKVHVIGPLTDFKTVLSGAGNPGAMWDVLSMHTVGRERHVIEPDLPGAMVVDFPQQDNLLVLSFLSLNLPHLLFLDRFAIWADPYDDPRAYGKLTHMEAERYMAGDSVRLRAGARPPSAGQSEAEVEIDYLFVNVPRMLFGVGLTGGTRGGGGPGVVWEWSSKD